MTVDQAKKVEMGATATSNKRVIKQFIHPLVMESCQLVLGYTSLQEGRSGTPFPPMSMTAGWRHTFITAWRRNRGSCT
ncbi:hypothetical protein FLP41_09980 [Paracoccus marcusii]|uniref:hypothetical protein n=1 Tax=Paracoccus marcusii TaxID=59779 RepID=UPI002ED2DBF8|nr:hypothetical protein FLP41_09980 [Paracoccus marcusii]